MAKPVARGYFDAVGASADPGVLCEDKSLAVQASRDETDINVIIRKYLKTGEMPGHRQGIFADLSEMTDLRDAMHIANEGLQAFMELPAEIRREFDNDPTKLVDFASDPKNVDRAIELGLLARFPEEKEDTPLPANKARPVAKGRAASTSDEVPPEEDT